MCNIHYLRAKKRGDLPPLHPRYRKGQHGLAEHGPDGTRFCVKCSGFVAVKPINKGKDWACSWSASAGSRLTRSKWEAEVYDLALIRQGNRCYICLQPEVDSTRGLSGDHDHITGMSRHLLCSRCNHALGHAKDNPEILRRMALYVEGNLPFLTGG
jgi:hypothetical protein